MFRWVLLSKEVKLIKPDPKIFALLLSRIEKPAGDCLFIDDALLNVAAARELGSRAVHFQAPGQLRAELRRMGILG